MASDPNIITEIKPSERGEGGHAAAELMRDLAGTGSGMGGARRVVGVCCSWDDATRECVVASLLKSVVELAKSKAEVLVLELSGVRRADSRLVACLVYACRLARRVNAWIVVVVSRAVADWLMVCGVSRIVPHVVV